MTKAAEYDIQLTGFDVVAPAPSTGAVRAAPTSATR